MKKIYSLEEQNTLNFKKQAMAPNYAPPGDRADYTIQARGCPCNEEGCYGCGEPAACKCSAMGTENCPGCENTEHCYGCGEAGNCECSGQNDQCSTNCETTCQCSGQNNICYCSGEGGECYGCGQTVCECSDQNNICYCNGEGGQCVSCVTCQVCNTNQSFCSNGKQGLTSHLGTFNSGVSSDSYIGQVESENLFKYINNSLNLCRYPSKEIPRLPENISDYSYIEKNLFDKLKIAVDKLFSKSGLTTITAGETKISYNEQMKKIENALKNTNIPTNIPCGMVTSDNGKWKECISRQDSPTYN